VFASTLLHCQIQICAFQIAGCEEKLKDKFGNLAYDVTSSVLDDTSMFPYAHEVKGHQLEVIQGQGQVIFVPSGWHHQVVNLVISFSFFQMIQYYFLIAMHVCFIFSY